MSLRKHRDKANGRRIKNRRMPSPDEQKLGTKIHEEDVENDLEAAQCIFCDNWFNSDDLDNGICFTCIKNGSEPDDLELENYNP